MSSRFFPLAVLSALLLTTGCSQVSSRLSEEASEAVQAVDEVLTEEAQAAETETEVVEEAEAETQTTALTQAEQAAAAAVETEKNAITDNDWNQALSQWRTAASFAASVPEDDGDRAAAQNKLAEYSDRFKQAEAKYAALVQNRYEVFSTAPSSNAGAANTYEADGKQVRAWIQTGAFDKVEALLKGAVQQKKLTRGGAYYADSVLRMALGGDDVVFSAEMMEQLNRWVEKSPSNPYAYITRAYAAQSFIWVKPYIYKIDGENSDPRRINLEDAEALGTPLMYSIFDTNKAQELAANNPLALLSELRLARIIAMSEGNDAMMEEAFRKVDAVLPYAYENYFENNIYLLSQDNSGDRALKFLRSKVGGAPSTSAMPMVFAVTHFALQGDNTNAREYLSQPDVWKEIQENTERVMEAYPNEGIYAGWYAYLAKKAERGDIARKYSQIAISRDASSAELQTWLRTMN